MTPGFTLHLLRHGAPEGAGRLYGHADPAPLAEHAAACADRARGLAFDDLVCSDLARAARPAARIGADRGIAPRADRRWRELAFGDWEGADPALLPEGALARFHADPDGHAPPGGERWTALRARVSAALEAITRSTLVVAHAGAIRTALGLLLGLEYRQTWAFAVPYAGLVSLEVWPGTPRTAQIVGLVT